MTAVASGVEGFQLSPQQEAVCQREGTEALATRVVRLAAAITAAELATRMEALVVAHEVLRTRYVTVSGLRVPVQVVDEPGPVEVEPAARGGATLRAGQLTVRHVQVAGGTVLELTLPRLSADPMTWSTLTGLLITAPNPDRPDALQYADVAAWLAEELERTATGRGSARAARPAYVPFRLPAPHQGQDAAPEMVSFVIAGRALDRLRASACGLGANEAAFVLAGWRSLHARYTRGEDDEVFVVADGRAAAGLSEILGLLERPVPARVPAAETDSFAQVVRAAASALAVVQTEECRHDPRQRSPQAQEAGDDSVPAASFRYREDPWAEITEPAPFSVYELPGVLHLDCVRGPSRLMLTVAGTGGQIAPADLDAFAAAFGELLADATADPGRTVGALRLLLPPSRPAWQHRRHQAVPHRFLDQAIRVPGRIAVRCAGEEVSYRDLARWARAVLAVLRQHGIRPGDHVPVLSSATAGTIAAMLGTWLAGAAFVPVDPAWPAERTRAVLAQLNAPLILVPDLDASDPLPILAVPVPSRSGLPEPAEAADQVAHGAAYVIFTSGTTGQPKGVIIGHDQLAHYVVAMLAKLRLPDGAGFAAVSTMAADLSYTAVFPTLASGGCVHLIDADVATSPAALADWFEADPVAAVKLVPSHLSALLAEASEPLELLPTEVLVLGGEKLPRALHDRLRELSPELRIFNHYGPTETTIGASCLALDGPVDERCGSVPVGATLGDNILVVVDEEGNQVPPWCPGEILIVGPGVGLGYLGVGRSGFGDRGTGPQYRSGDLGRMVPGLGVEVIGRIDDQVKLHGYRIQLGEIEGLLTRQPGVAAAAVLARSDVGGLVSHLDAYVAGGGDDGDPPRADDLRTALVRQLPAALVPTGWQVLDRLPLTSNGKVDRRALAPVQARRSQAARPRDAIEQHLVELWSEILGLDSISPHDDFFDLGGHSLYAIKLIARVNIVFGCSLPMATVFTARTVAAMADLLRYREVQDGNLVPLRHVQGDRLPDGSAVFCFHPGGGTTLSYWELARALPAGRQVFGVESWGLHGRAPQEDFAEMAREYAAAIAATGAAAPVLVGWCFGGLVARETAQALRRAGRAVGALVLVDCPAPGFESGTDEAFQEAQLISQSTLISRFAWHIEADLPTGPGPSGDDMLLNAMRHSGHLPASAGQDEVGTIVAMYTANMTAWERHVADGPPYPVPDYPVLLVRAEAADQPPDQDRTWGWRSAIGSSLGFAAVNADHHSILRPPAVGELATMIARAGDRD